MGNRWGFPSLGRGALYTKKEGSVEIRWTDQGTGMSCVLVSAFAGVLRGDSDVSKGDEGVAKAF